MDPRTSGLKVWVTPAAIRYIYSDLDTAEPAYSYIVYSRFLAIVKLNLVPFGFIS